ncbi:hypothetical protein NFH98_20880 [Halomonas sp. H33-56]|uniref:hypothetical protein n=1 Tax=Halomonas sp. H33-56 TaxID=2950873 RepID=UPI0032DE377F
MELNDWIDEFGLEGAAALLKEKPRTVYSWYRFQKAPRLASALNIVVRTRGRVDYNGIYGPLARARAEVA